MACTLLALGNHEIANGDESWTEYLEGSSCVVTYTEAVYFTVLSITSVGYGDQMVTTVEKALNSLFLLLAQLFTAKVCADLTWLTSTRNYWEAHNQAKQAQTWTALQKMAVPPVLARPGMRTAERLPGAGWVRESDGAARGAVEVANVAPRGGDSNISATSRVSPCITAHCGCRKNEEWLTWCCHCKKPLVLVQATGGASASVRSASGSRGATLGPG
ncbi:unnamed protein product [Prorocentrum cordatum]|uniref:Potassium channel domain-containing protein n=1 Tax=Prorocentrum cordatum TaxID=2364126 RepID=A0ABN9TFI7_9DINO|nr:unnamed protein product [Polarella glacialis]